MTRLPSSARRRQRGEIILITLVMLLVSLLGLLAAMRSGMIDTLMNGHNLARQKDVHVGDIALRQIESQILSSYGSAPLETSAANQAWYRDVAAGTAAPDAAYWSGCLGSATASARCGAVALAANGAALPYKAYVAVQPTGRYDTTSCSMGTAGQYTAAYYDIYIHVMEQGGATAVNTETVYRLCTINA